jgi:hypothetical protein
MPDMRKEPHLREEDSECVGYVVEAPGGFEPLSLLGHRIGPVMELHEVYRLLESDNLSSISRDWFARSPEPLEPGTDLRAGDETWRWRRFVVSEVTPQRATLGLAFPGEEERGAFAVVNLPADDILYEEPDS